MAQMNIVNDLLYQPIQAGNGEKIILLQKNYSVTYIELSKMVTQCVHYLQAKKIPQRSIVACVMQDSIFFVAMFLALMHQDLIPCLLNFNMTQEACKGYLKDCQAKMLIVDADGYQKFTSFLPEINIPIEFADEKLFYLQNAMEDLIKTPEVILGDEVRAAFCLFTSGTTGKPSAVLHRHIDVRQMNQDYGKTILAIQPNDRLFATSRFYFAYGLNALLFSLMNKALLIIPPVALDISTIWGFIEYYQPTIFFSVPTVYARLLKEKSYCSLSFVRLCISAGETLPSKIHQDWLAATGKNILDGIGTTEVLSTFISNRIGQLKYGSAGLPVAGFSAEIRHADNSLVSPGSIGVLWVRGNTYQEGYLNNAEASQERFCDGWFKTNDLFSQDEEGFFYYHGRANDLIKVSGIWIYPEKIEQALNSHPAVFESAVIGEVQENGLLRPKAFVVLNESFCLSETLMQDLQQWCKDKCSKYEYPHYIHCIHDIPKTASGKLRRFILQTDQESIHVNH